MLIPLLVANLSLIAYSLKLHKIKSLANVSLTLIRELGFSVGLVSIWRKEIFDWFKFGIVIYFIYLSRLLIFARQLYSNKNFGSYLLENAPI